MAITGSTAFTNLLFLALTWFDRTSTQAHWVLPAMLIVFVLTQLPVFLTAEFLHAPLT